MERHEALINRQRMGVERFGKSSLFVIPLQVIHTRCDRIYIVSDQLPSIGFFMGCLQIDIISVFVY